VASTSAQTGPDSEGRFKKTSKLVKEPRVFPRKQAAFPSPEEMKRKKHFSQRFPRAEAGGRPGPYREHSNLPCLSREPAGAGLRLQPMRWFSGDGERQVEQVSHL